MVVPSRETRNSCVISIGSRIMADISNNPLHNIIIITSPPFDKYSGKDLISSTAVVIEALVQNFTVSINPCDLYTIQYNNYYTVFIIYFT